MFNNKNLTFKDIKLATDENWDEIHDEIADLTDGTNPVFIIENKQLMLILNENGSTICEFIGYEYSIGEFLKEVEFIYNASL